MNRFVLTEMSVSLIGVHQSDSLGEEAVVHYGDVRLYILHYNLMQGLCPSKRIYL